MTSCAQVPLDDVFSLPATAKLDTATMARIARRGFSRIPIAMSARKGSLSGYLLTKELVCVSPTDASQAGVITQYATHVPAWTGPTHSLFELLEEFKSGRCHMAFVSRNPELSRASVANGEVPSGSAACIGVITLEDVIEEILMQEVYDETDLMSAAAAQTEAEDLMSSFVPRLRERFGRKLAEYAASPTTPGGRTKRARHVFSERQAAGPPEGSRPLLSGQKSDAACSSDAAC